LVVSRRRQDVPRRKSYYQRHSQRAFGQSTFGLGTGDCAKGWKTGFADGEVCPHGDDSWRLKTKRRQSLMGRRYGGDAKVLESRGGCLVESGCGGARNAAGIALLALSLGKEERLRWNRRNRKSQTGISRPQEPGKPRRYSGISAAKQRAATAAVVVAEKIEGGGCVGREDTPAGGGEEEGRGAESRGRQRGPKIGSPRGALLLIPPSISPGLAHLATSQSPVRPVRPVRPLPVIQSLGDYPCLGLGRTWGWRRRWAPFSQTSLASLAS
jgi:hypothetical protein